jgi:SAM-dependent methyltransferase
MIRDETFRRKLPFRGRGVAELERRIGGVHAEIDARLARGNVVQVLELGCGYGTALLELCARYGGRAALHGVNRVPHDGNLDILRRNARVLGVFGDTPPDVEAWARLALAVVAAGLPFTDDSFDVVYRQVAWP